MPKKKTKEREVLVHLTSTEHMTNDDLRPTFLSFDEAFKYAITNKLTNAEIWVHTRSRHLRKNVKLKYILTQHDIDDSRL